MYIYSILKAHPFLNPPVKCIVIVQRVQIFTTRQNFRCFQIESFGIQQIKSWYDLSLFAENHCEKTKEKVLVTCAGFKHLHLFPKMFQRYFCNI